MMMISRVRLSRPSWKLVGLKTTRYIPKCNVIPPIKHRFLHQYNVTPPVHHLLEHNVTAPVKARYLHEDNVDPPMKRYNKLLKQGVLNVDVQQFQAVAKIQDVYNELSGYSPSQEDNHGKGKVPPKGLYLHGGVGTGKTLLLDLLFDSIPTQQKKRVHFNAFMIFLYSEINRWNLCLEDEVDFVTPTEHLANKILKDAWLICFDEIQLADYASCALLQGVFLHMIEKGAVIIGTSNRSPGELGDLSITDTFDGETGGVQETLASFKSMFVNNCHLHHLTSERDHRAEMGPGQSRFFHPCTPENDEKLDIMFASLVPPATRITSSTVELYGRKVLIPLSAGSVARFSFHELCCQPLGPADYIRICNSFDTIFVEHVPKMNIGRKNEARRLLSFIDAAYESRVKVYCTAETPFDKLFLMLPRNDEDYEPEQMHMEMIGEIAYDLKLHGMDFRSLNIISGEDEIFSFKRAISRLKEMQSTFYQATSHRRQHFSPYVGSEEEIDSADARRKLRETRRQEKIKESMANKEGEEEATDEMKLHTHRHHPVTSSEAAYLTSSRETSQEVRSQKQDSLPKFNEMHFWGAGWWENTKKKWKPPEDK